MASSVPRIFVSIAAYRDPECQWTIKDLFEKAYLPDRVNVGICWQVLPEDDDDCFLFATRPRQCRALNVHVRDSWGACWARAQVQTLWQGEEYYLQIDSHMRFAPDWDKRLLDMIAECPSPRPVLSTYPCAYTPPDQRQEGSFSVMYPRQFNDDGVLSLHARLFALADSPKHPIPSPFCSGGLLFAPAQMIIDVPYDPNLYFIGEEITMAARLWTRGWDIFAPYDNLIYHDYGRTRARHWRDNSNWAKANRISVKRINHLLGVTPSDDPDVLRDLDRFGLGTVRSLESFQKFGGISFQTRTINARPLGSPWPRHAADVVPEAAADRPEDIPVLLKEGHALAKERRDEPAICRFDRVLALVPDHIDANYSKANALLRLKRHAEAAGHYRRAARDAGYRPEALYGAAIALDALQRWPEAAAALAEAAAAKPEVRYWRLLSSMHFRMAELPAAESAARQALTMQDGDVEAHFALAIALLNAGNPEGWHHYEWRWQRTVSTSPYRYTEYPEWRGEPLGGKRLLLWEEQGIGDEIMFARHISGLAARAAACVIECDPRLETLFARSFPQCQVVPRRNPGLAPSVDFQAPCGSLRLRTGEDFSTQPFPYLRPDPARREALRRRLLEEEGAPGPRRLLVALSWRSSSPHGGSQRSTVLTDWAPVLTLPGVRFINVQYGRCEEELAAARAAGFAVESIADVDVWNDIDGLAALLAACDLYLGIDNSTAHLAAAVGLETLVVLLYRADWRWPLAGETTPLYPTMRLLRQPAPDDWTPVLRQAAAELERRTEQK